MEQGTGDRTDWELEQIRAIRTDELTQRTGGFVHLCSPLFTCILHQYTNRMFLWD